VYRHKINQFQFQHQLFQISGNRVSTEKNDYCATKITLQGFSVTVILMFFF